MFIHIETLLGIMDGMPLIYLWIWKWYPNPVKAATGACMKIHTNHKQITTSRKSLFKPRSQLGETEKLIWLSRENIQWVPHSTVYRLYLPIIHHTNRAHSIHSRRVGWVGGNWFEPNAFSHFQFHNVNALPLAFSYWWAHNGVAWWNAMATADTMEHSYPLLCLDSVPDSWDVGLASDKRNVLNWQVV